MRRMEAHVPVSGIGDSSEQVRQSIIARVKSPRSSYECTLRFLILKKVTLDLPTTNVNIANWKIPEHIGLADPQFNVMGKVDLLIGAEVFLDLLLQETYSLGPDLPTLRNSRIGWLISGSYIAKPSRDLNGLKRNKNAKNYFNGRQFKVKVENM
uniref:DUF1758 domain-containing protein n=1 Tax=Anopheles epiroticus TaxID=199890 RepID=A0A182PWQ0_9DIPT